MRQCCSGVFPKWSITFTEFSEFRENDNHWSMNWAQFKGPVSHVCCVGAVVACWPLTQVVAGWQGFESFYWMTYFCKNLQTFRENPIRIPNACFVHCQWISVLVGGEASNEQVWTGVLGLIYRCIEVLGIRYANVRRAGYPLAVSPRGSRNFLNFVCWRSLNLSATDVYGALLLRGILDLPLVSHVQVWECSMFKVEVEVGVGVLHHGSPCLETTKYHVTYPMIHVVWPSPYKHTHTCENIIIPERRLHAVIRQHCMDRTGYCPFPVVLIF